MGTAPANWQTIQYNGMEYPEGEDKWVIYDQISWIFLRNYLQSVSDDWAQSTQSNCWICIGCEVSLQKRRNGILLPKLFWPTVRKKCSSDWEKCLKFEAEFFEISRTIFSNSEKSEQFLKQNAFNLTTVFFNIFCTDTLPRIVATSAACAQN